MQHSLQRALFDLQFARRFGRLTGLYWRSPDARKGALLLGLAIALELATVYGSFVLADAQRRIYDALQDRAAAAFFSGVALFAGRRARIRARVDVPHLRPAGARDPLANLADRSSARGLDQPARVQPDGGGARRRRQSRSAHRRGRAQLRRERARPVAFAARGARDAGRVRRASCGACRATGRSRSEARTSKFPGS